MTPPSVKLTKDGVHVALNSDPQPHPSPLPIFEAYRKILLPFLLYVNDGSLLVSSQIQSRSYKLFLPFLHAEPPEGFPQQQRLTWVGLATLLHYSGHTPAGALLLGHPGTVELGILLGTLTAILESIWNVFLALEVEGHPV